MLLLSGCLQFFAKALFLQIRWGEDQGLHSEQQGAAVRGSAGAGLHRFDIDPLLSQGVGDPMDDAFMVGAMHFDSEWQPAGMALGITEIGRSGSYLVTESSQAGHGLLKFFVLAGRQVDKEQDGKLAAQPGHAAGFDIATQSKQTAGDFLDDADPVGAGQGKDDLAAHALVLLGCYQSTDRFGVSEDQMDKPGKSACPRI